MDLSKLTASDKRILYASIGVIVGGVVGIVDAWGFGSNIGLLAGIAAAVVVLLPQLAPTAKLPATKSLVLLVCGAVAAGGFALSILTWLARPGVDAGHFSLLARRNPAPILRPTPQRDARRPRRIAFVVAPRVVNRIRAATEVRDS